MKKHLDSLTMPPFAKKAKKPAPKGGFGPADPEDDPEAEDVLMDDLDTEEDESAPEQSEEAPGASDMLADATDDDLVAEAERRGYSISKAESEDDEEEEDDLF